MSEEFEAKVVRNWVQDLMKRTGLKATPLAKGAGLSPSTLLRALDEDSPTELDRRSIRKLVEKYNVAAPAIAEPQLLTPDPDEPELILPEEVTSVFAGKQLTAAQYVREINTRAIELVGYWLGDMTLFDTSVSPEGGDIVEALVYNPVRGTAETVPRLYDPPYIVARTTDPTVNQKPLLVDGSTVRIVSVALMMQRERK